MTLFYGKIPGRSSACYANEEAFVEGMEVISLLEAEVEQIERKDFCLNCWEGIPQTSKLKIVGFWKDEVKAKIKKEKPKTPDEKALDLLKRMLGDTEHPPFHMAYVLACYLQRCGQLVLRKELMDAKESERLFFEDVASSEILCIKKIELSFAKIQSIQQEIVAQLDIEPKKSGSTA